jgi:hypothetical protein
MGNNARLLSPLSGLDACGEVIQGLRASLRSTLTPGYLIAPLRGTLSRFAARICFRQQLAPPCEHHPSQPRTPVGNHRESVSTIKFRFSTTRFRFSIAKFRFSTTTFRFSTIKFRFSTIKVRFSTTTFRFSTPRAWPAMTERWFWKYRAVGRKRRVDSQVPSLEFRFTTGLSMSGGRSFTISEHRFQALRAISAQPPVEVLRWGFFGVGSSPLVPESCVGRNYWLGSGSRDAPRRA